MDQLQQVFEDNEPELRLIGYLPNHEAHFQLLDCDSVRIGKMICKGVRTLSVQTEFESYARLIRYSLDTLPSELAWMSGGLPLNRPWLFVLLPVKHHGGLALVSTLPRIGGHPHGYIICESLTYVEEDDPGYG